MPTIHVNGGDIHYLHAPGRGDGPAPTLVCVHGLGTDSLASFYLTLAAPLTAAGINMIFYDLRGHGNSERPASGYRVHDFVADLDGLLTALDVPSPVHLVGNSFGGTIAFAFAAAHPDRTASIVSIESEPPTTAWADRVGQVLENTRQELAREETYQLISATFGDHHARLSRQAFRRLQETTMAEEIPAGPFLDLVDLGRIRVPVLSIIGSDGFQSEDPFLLEGLLPNCRTVVLQDQDHSVLVEAHRRVRDLLLDWIFSQNSVAAGPGGRT
ncbi:Pimeloyl-ACP methyl ester carboxylesterase [Parafrankia irregularis]|uniref:Pimeloyl-ACP methyl ester carboxylesterase n=1 Tax=Parafrankia irregularis TaxID=795642 RepID=A0A0S4QMY0_9ACTN|nr:MULTISPECIES: alpha/beta hydrolase [Frankiaceae]KPM52277.1 hydrolase [Frankia sp. R43]MBE3206081.1 alpha/beta hydrolase [Parafrankia sp. CH37]CUU57035.1 Pimeloyl-ACP methyl ester carboxylesterase [Parafrankia irregularis]